MRSAGIRSGNIVRPSVLLSLVACLWLPPVTASAAGDAPTREECGRAAEEAQRLRVASRLTATREQLLICVRGECPGFVQADCAKWLAETEASLPSVVVQAITAAGQDIEDAELAVDDARMDSPRMGAAFVVDPGAHTLRVTAPGYRVFEQRFVAREGEKNRLLKVVLVTSNRLPIAPPLPAPRTVAPMTVAVSGAAAPRSAGLAPWGLGLGAVSLAALGTTIAFGAIGVADRANLERTCSPHCSSTQVAPVNVDFDVADIALGVTLAAAALATYAFVSHRNAPPLAALLTASPTPSGAMAGIHLSFE